MAREHKGRAIGFLVREAAWTDSVMGKDGLTVAMQNGRQIRKFAQALADQDGFEYQIVSVRIERVVKPTKRRQWVTKRQLRIRKEE